MDIFFTGTTAVLPEADRDTASYLIDGNIMVDCGWWATLGLQRYGLNPFAVRHLLLTHCHHDHCMGLPQLLFYKGYAGENDAQKQLTIWGPSGDAEEMTDLACRFLRADRFPGVTPDLTVNPLLPGDSFKIRETTVRTCGSLHPVPGLCYRLDAPTGESIVLSGDTAYNTDLVELAQGADLLIHEASYGASAPDGNTVGHSGGVQAALAAKEAGVKQLVLVHTTEARRQAAVAAAKEIFGNVSFAEEGDRIQWMKDA